MDAKDRAGLGSELIVIALSYPLWVVSDLAGLQLEARYIARAAAAPAWLGLRRARRPGATGHCWVGSRRLRAKWRGRWGA